MNDKQFIPLNERPASYWKEQVDNALERYGFYKHIHDTHDSPERKAAMQEMMNHFANLFAQCMWRLIQFEED